MSEWLDLMLGEIARKKREKEAALEELERRQRDEDDVQPDPQLGDDGVDDGADDGK